MCYGMCMATVTEGHTMTKQARNLMATTPDEHRVVTMADAKALPGLMGQVAAVHLEAHGVYGYRRAETGETVRLVLAGGPCDL